MEVEMREPDMSLEDAGMLLSAMGNLQFRQVVDPKRTVRMEMKKTVLNFAALNSCLLLRRVYEERAIADTT